MNDGLEFDELVGSNVRKYRAACGLSQVDLAAAMSSGGEHIPQQTVAKIEGGSRSLKYVEAMRICAALNIDVTQLSEGAEHTDANTRYLQRFAVLGQMVNELDEFADRLASVEADLANLVASERGDAWEGPTSTRSSRC